MKTWPKVKLGDVCVINPKVQSPDVDSLISVVPMSAVSETGEIDASAVQPFGDVSKGLTLFQEGDVLFAKITPCMENGKGAVAVGLQGGIGAGSTEFFVFRPDFNRVTSAWIYYFTKREAFRRLAAERMTGSGGQRRVPRVFLECVTLPLPPIAEQERIAAELDAVVATLKKRQTQLAELNALVEARFVELFGDPATNPKGWPKKAIKTLFDLVSRGKQPAYIENSFIAVVNQACIYNDFFKFQNLKYFDPTSNKKTLEIQEGDILVNSTGTGTLGRCNIFVPTDAKTYVIDSHVTLLRPSKVVLPLFFKTFFLAQPTQEKFYADCVSGSTNQIELSKEKFLRFEIPLPPLELQERFAAEVERVEAIKAKVRDGIAETQTLFDALTQRYFG